MARLTPEQQLCSEGNAQHLLTLPYFEDDNKHPSNHGSTYHYRRARYNKPHIFTCEKFRAWEASQDGDSERILCLVGPAHSGKTRIATMIVGYLKENVPFLSYRAVLHYICDTFGDTQTSAEVKVLQSLIRQLVLLNPGTFADQVDVGKTGCEDVKNLWIQLCSLSEKVDGPVWIIVDGTDGMKELNRLLLWCTTGKMRVIVTASTELQPKHCDIYGSQEEEIVRYLDHWIANHPEHAAHRQTVLTVVEEKGYWNMQYTSTLLTQLTAAPSFHVAGLLESVSQGLDELYRHLITIAPTLFTPAGIALRNRILSFALKSYCPLTLTELIAIHSLITKQSSAQRRPNEKKLFHLCAPFLNIIDTPIHASGLLLPIKDKPNTMPGVICKPLGRVFQFANSTARDVLADVLGQAGQDVALDCLRVAHEILSSPVPFGKERDSFHDQYHYPLHYWSRHFASLPHSIESEKDGLVWTAARDFFFGDGWEKRIGFYAVQEPHTIVTPTSMINSAGKYVEFEDCKSYWDKCCMQLRQKVMRSDNIFKDRDAELEDSDWVEVNVPRPISLGPYGAPPMEYSMEHESHSPLTKADMRRIRLHLAMAMQLPFPFVLELLAITINAGADDEDDDNKYHLDRLIVHGLNDYNLLVVDALVAHIPSFPSQCFRDCFEHFGEYPHQTNNLIVLLSNTRTEIPHNALLSAVKHQNIEALKLMLNHGAEVIPPPPSTPQPAPLHCVPPPPSGSGKLLTEAIRFPRHHSSFCIESCAVGAAVIAGSVPALSHLLDSGAPLPANIVAYVRSPPILAVLLHRKANPNGTNMFGETLLDQLLIKSGEVLRQDALEMMKILLAAGAQTDTFDARQTTPLFRASENGDMEKVKLLVEDGGADVNLGSKYIPHISYMGPDMVKTNERWINVPKPPIYIAACHGHLDMVAYLLRRGAKHALSVTAGTGNVGAVRRLLEAGLDVNERDSAGWTAVHRAVLGAQQVFNFFLRSIIKYQKCSQMMPYYPIMYGFPSGQVLSAAEMGNPPAMIMAPPPPAPPPPMPCYLPPPPPGSTHPMHIYAPPPPPVIEEDTYTLFGSLLSKNFQPGEKKSRRGTMDLAREIRKLHSYVAALQTANNMRTGGWMGLYTWYEEYVEVVEVLLEWGADVNLLVGSGDNEDAGKDKLVFDEDVKPGMHVLEMGMRGWLTTGRREVVDILVDAGADDGGACAKEGQRLGLGVEFGELLSPKTEVDCPWR